MKFVSNVLSGSSAPFSGGGKSRFVCGVLAVILALAVVVGGVESAFADIWYLNDSLQSTQLTGEYATLNADTNTWPDTNNTIVVAKDASVSLTADNPISISSATTLILCEGGSLTVTGGFSIASNATLTICAGVEADSDPTSITGGNLNTAFSGSGTLNIYGVNITADNDISVGALSIKSATVNFIEYDSEGKTTYTLTYDPNGGKFADGIDGLQTTGKVVKSITTTTPASATTLTPSTAIGTLITDFPTRAGYKSDGKWHNGEEEVTAETTIAGHTIVYAGWEGYTEWGVTEGGEIDGSEAHPFEISTAEGWNLLTTEIASDTAGTYDNSYFKLTADISVSTMVGTSAYPFKGHFLGNGYTLTVTLGSDEVTEGYVAPFAYVEGATIDDLTVAGTITTKTATVGGIVGYATGETISITDCEFVGQFRVTNGSTANAGGFVANNATTADADGVSITRGLYAPATLSDSDPNYHNPNTSYSGEFVSQLENGGKSISLARCYYTETLAATGASISRGTYAHTLSPAENSGLKLVLPNDDDSISALNYNGTIYAGTGEKVTFTITGGDSIEGYKIGDTELTATDGKYSYTMTAANLTVTPYITYLDSDGQMQTTSNYTKISENADSMTLEDGKTYVVTANTTIITLTITGAVNLIIADNVTLTVTDLIGSGENATLTTYYQSTNEATKGKLMYTTAKSITLDGVTYDSNGNTSSGGYDFSSLTTPTITHHSMILGGELSVMFYAYFPDGFDSKDYSMSFDVGGDKTQNPTPQGLYKSATVGTTELYGGQCYITSVQMADTIRAQLLNGSNEVVDSHDYSAKIYLDALTSDDLAETITATYGEYAIPLGKAIQDYGHYVQIMLEAEHGTTHTEMPAAKNNNFSQITANTVQDYAIKVLDSANSGSYTITTASPVSSDMCFSLLLSDDTTIRIYMRPMNNAKIFATISDTTYTPTAITAGEMNGYSYVDINGIGANALDTTHTVAIKTGDNAESATTVFNVNLSALSYVYSVLGSTAYTESTTPTEEQMKNAVTAIYNYNVAAKAYDTDNNKQDYVGATDESNSD